MISASFPRIAIRSGPSRARRKMLGAFVWLALSAAPALATELTGIVRDAEGEPVSNVPVTLSTSEVMSTASVAFAESRTDSEGNFRISVPDHWFDAPDFWRQELSLVARAPDRGIGGVVVHRELPLPRQRLTIRLERWTKRPIKLQTADNKPLVGVNVRLINLQLPAVFPSRFSRTNARHLATIPSELRSTGTTNDAGVAELLLPPVESVAAMEAEIEKNLFVSWTVRSNNSSVPKDWSKNLQVPSLRRIPVELTFQGSDPSELSLSVTAMPRVSYGATTTIRHVVDLDEAGKSTVAIQDNAMLLLKNVSNKPTKMHLSPSSFLNAALLETMRVSFDNGVRVTGRAISKQGEPAASIRLVFSSNMAMRYVNADTDGRFEFMAPPGQLMLVPGARSGYRAEMIGPNSAVVIPATADTHDLGELTFTRLETLQGIVRDESGRPVSGATVMAKWSEPNAFQRGLVVNCEEQLATNEDGTFTIAHLDPSAEPRLVARYAGAMTERPREFRLDGTPASLTIKRSAAISVSGRVTDANGNGIDGLEVTLRSRLEPPNTDTELPVGADVDGPPLITDSNGDYATPKSLPPWGEYVALIRTDTKREAFSGWEMAKPGKTLVLPVIEDFQTTELNGRILNANGKPLAKARVVVLTSDGQAETTTNDDGTFEIDRPAGRSPLLIAEADGFFASGVAVEAGKAFLELRLPRLNQLPPKSQDASDGRAIQTTRWTREQKRKLASQLADGFDNSDPQLKAQMDAAFARYWPQHILDRLDSLPSNKERLGQMIRTSLALGLAADRPQEGLQLLDAFPDGPMKPHMLFQFERSATMPDEDRMQLLARIVQDARGLRQAEFRVAVMGLVGERLLDLGQKDSGEALLRESLKDAEQLSPAAFSGYARGVFAEELAQIDADQSLDLIEPLTDNSEFNRHLRNIAHELAARDPDRAIAILDKMRAPDENRRPLADSRELAALRVCYRMIRVAPDKAMQLGRSIKHVSLGPHSLGLMADSLLNQDSVSDADRDVARQLHDEAWRMLATVRREEDLTEFGYLYPSTIAALLLQQTAKIAPDELTHRIWQTIALRRPIENSGPHQWTGLGCACEMALLLADVDPNRARQVAAWLPTSSAGSRRFANYVQYARTAPHLIAELHPDQCEASLAAVMEPAANNRLRLSLVRALLRTGDAHARGIRNEMGLWFPDDEDLVQIE